MLVKLVLSHYFSGIFIMQLFGSITSPYVRRIRLFLADRDYQFINIDIFSEQGRQAFELHNPANKVPFLIDGEQTIIDSRVIYRYLTQKYQQPEPSWAQENLLSLIDAANDSFVSLLLLTRSGIDTAQDSLFFNLQHQRIDKVLTKLELAVNRGDFEQWDYPTICLYCLLDWVNFRQLFDMTIYPALAHFHKQYQSLGIVKETTPSS